VRSSTDYEVRMRVTGNQLIDAAQASTSRAQESLARATAQVSSGLRVEKPSDDPTAWLAAHRAGLRKAVLDGSRAAVVASRERLDQTDGALATIGDAVSEVRALAIQGASGSYNAADRAELAVHVRALFESALAAANTQAPDGEYLLAGAASLTEPFDATGAYQGDARARQIASGDTMSIPGSELTAARGVDVLPLLDRVAKALAANDTTALATAIDDLGTAVSQVSLARTRTGGASAVLDETLVAHDALADHLTTTMANAVEVDAVAAATDLAKASQALEISRAVTSHVVALLDPSTP
jgi:flagellar hook-associated protein 3 FlgL